MGLDLGKKLLSFALCVPLSLSSFGVDSLENIACRDLGHRQIIMYGEEDYVHSLSYEHTHFYIYNEWGIKYLRLSIGGLAMYENRFDRMDGPSPSRVLDLFDGHNYERADIFIIDSRDCNISISGWRIPEFIRRVEVKKV